MVYLIREASLDEVHMVHQEWARRERWNPGREDWKNFSSINPQGFLVGELDGEIIACISAVELSPAYGFIGYYICKEEYRGQGFGLQIFQAARNKLIHLSCIGLDGVPAQVHNYRKSSFLPYFESARHLIQNTGQFSLAPDELSSLVDMKESEARFLDALQFQQMKQGVQMENYFRSLFKDIDVKALSYYSDNGSLSGFGVIRPAADGWRIAPLYANNLSIGTVLFKALIGSIPLNENIYIDIPMNNNSAVNFVQAFNLKSTSACVRMYSGQPPCFVNDHIFALVSWEVGP